jgi:hypothetical protein
MERKEGDGEEGSNLPIQSNHAPSYLERTDQKAVRPGTAVQEVISSFTKVRT